MTNELMKARLQFNDYPLEIGQLELLSNRQEVLDRMEQACKSANVGSIESYAILGEDGMGKTSILNVVHEMAANEDKILPISLEVTEETTEYHFFRELAKQLVGGLNPTAYQKLVYLITTRSNLDDLKKAAMEMLDRETITRTEKETLSFSILNLINFGLNSSIQRTRGQVLDIDEVLNIINSLKDVLKKIYNGVIVFIDESGYSATPKSKSLLQRMRIFFHSRPFMVVFAGNPNIIAGMTQIVPNFPNMIPEYNRLDLEPLKLVHVEELIVKRLQEASVNPFKAEDVIETILRESGGNPRYIIRLCRIVIDNLIKEKRQLAAPADIRSASDKILSGRGEDIYWKLTQTQRNFIDRIYDNGSSAYLEDIINQAGLSQGWTSNSLNTLLKLGYLKKSPDSKDKRKTIYLLMRPLNAYLKTVRE